MQLPDDIPIVDATTAPITAVAPELSLPQADPALAVTVALANELQQVYADDHSKLQEANRTLRKAVQ